MKGVGFALPFLSGQNIQGIALGEIFQSRGAEPGAVINLYFNGYTAAVRTTQEGFGVPYLGIAQSVSLDRNLESGLSDHSRQLAYHSRENLRVDAASRWPGCSNEPHIVWSLL